MEVSICSYSLNHILGKGENVDDGSQWFFAGMYGFPEEPNKKKTQDLMKSLSGVTNGSWLCFGDLNDVLAAQEKKGGNPRTFDQLNMGRCTMEECGLLDLGFSGYLFTWSNGRKGPDQIQCRLDRAMATKGFINTFSPIQVSHLPRFGSDHSALKICLEFQGHHSRKEKHHIFRFEECWAKDDRCEDMIKKLWQENSLHCEAKLQALRSLDEGFKEYRTSEVRRNILKTEALLKDESL